MATKTVTFEYMTGLRRPMFRNARLRGSWNSSGRYSEEWTERPMQPKTGSDGCPMFTASVSLDLQDRAQTFRWGVALDGPQGTNFWGIPTEVKDVHSVERHRELRMREGSSAQTERFHLTHCRHLGANKHFPLAGSAPQLRFGVFAPNAKAVHVVFADPARGYIADDGSGLDASEPIVELARSRDGIWEGGPAGDFAHFKSRPYMYRIRNAQGRTVYRTDIFSRSQYGKGQINPAKGHWPGTAETLDGLVSCSVVIDPDVVRRTFESTRPGTQLDLIAAEEFWATEFSSGRPVPTRVEDLIIYELHVGSLGFGRSGAGDLRDAMSFLDHLADLGVNAVELLPMAEFGGTAGWGYGSSHHFCIESSAGGRDKYRHFVRESHRRGIAVIQDVVYNHYDFNVERAQWQYDSTLPEENIYYWYEGRSSDYPDANGGYLDNESSGFAPRYWEEYVRHQFISSAAFLVEEMHVDGLRVDLTQALHRDNRLHADGRSIGNANVFGQKLLREWSRTLHMIRPTTMLIAEDHTGWDAVVKPPAQGGLGFDATWEVAFYHSLIGDAKMAGDRPRLLKQAGFGGDEPLAMDRFAAVLYDTRHNRVVFHESHDEAGNADSTHRTIATAVNAAPLTGATRIAAEARCRVVFGLSLLSAGTPMFFMGEEVGARKDYKYDNFISQREDIAGERAGEGRRMFLFYQDLISLSRRLRSTRSHNIDILHHSNTNRIIAFKRWSGDEQVIVVASFNNHAFVNGYVIEKDALAIPDAGWKEVFNSDADIYGGQNTGNLGAIVQSHGQRIQLVVPANAFVVLVKQ